VRTCGSGSDSLRRVEAEASDTPRPNSCKSGSRVEQDAGHRHSRASDGALMPATAGLMLNVLSGAPAKRFTQRSRFAVANELIPARCSVLTGLDKVRPDYSRANSLDRRRSGPIFLRTRHGTIPRNHDYVGPPRRERSRWGATDRSRLGNVVVKAERHARCGACITTAFSPASRGGTADAFTLFERFEAKLDKHQGNLLRSARWSSPRTGATDRVLRRLEAMSRGGPIANHRSHQPGLGDRHRAGAGIKLVIGNRLGRPLRAGRLRARSSKHPTRRSETVFNSSFGARQL